MVYTCGGRDFVCPLDASGAVDARAGMALAVVDIYKIALMTLTRLDVDVFFRQALRGALFGNVFLQMIGIWPCLHLHAAGESEGKASADGAYITTVEFNVTHLRTTDGADAGF